MMGVLMDSCTQWRDLHMELRHELRQILAPVKYLLPNLRQLSLSGGNNYNQGDPWDLFEVAPQLSSLTYFVNSVRGHNSHNIVSFLQPFRWEQLRHLDCETSLPAAQCLNMLSSTHNLQTARLYICYDGDSTPDTSETRAVHLTQLRHLNIVYDPTCNPSALLGRLYTPLVTSFEIGISDRYGLQCGPNCAPALARFLSQCTELRTLALRSRLWHADDAITIGSDAVLRVLQLTPHLRELTLNWCDGDTLCSEFITAFAAAPPASLLPHLTSITLEDSSGPDVDMSALTDALRSRASRGLRDVVISRKLSATWFPGQPTDGRLHSALRLTDETVVGELRRLRGLGLRVGVLVEGRSSID
ncbi:hypothetical protein FIBSPDRAFT_440917 [Athelia psychrophila]|uniref:RNI-like protein n=1 Tax=Athelia psychrophila TaxID=1759441 RepID=A0A166MFX4_9AGAM|nr:hypothetical protein FIBSPDRAFT_440917 [Fibularhizoctonia sp. CBS 109695]